jgi:hypothetical protein
MVGLSVAVSLAAVGLAAAAAHTSRGIAPADVTATTTPETSTTTPGVWSVPISRSDALATAQADKAEVPTSDSFSVKLTTWSELTTAEQTAGESQVPTAAPGDLNADGRIWIVAVDGSFTPSFGLAAEPAFHWGVIVIDAESGSALATYAGVSGNEAPYFAAMQDHGPVQ